MSIPTREDLAFEPAITFEDVWVGFDEGQVLRGVTFQVRERETLILLGETGTGKTLTLKMAAGLLAPNSGRVVVLGNEVSEMKENELLAFRRKVGFVFQEGALFDSMTVGENVAYRLREDRIAEEEIEPRVREVLRFVGAAAVGIIRGHETKSLDCQSADQPAADRAVRFTNGRTRSDNLADDHYTDFAAARRVRSDGAAGHAPITGRLCAGEFPFRSGNQTGGSKHSKW